MHPSPRGRVDHDLAEGVAVVLGRLPDGPCDAQGASMTGRLRLKGNYRGPGHHAEGRQPAQVASQWREAASVDRRLLRYTVHGAWWETLAASGITLLITREYEHLVMAVRSGEPEAAIS